MNNTSTKKIGFPISGRKGERGNWQGARPGGADLSALNLAVKMSQMGFQIVVILDQDGPTVDYIIRLGLDYVVINLPSIDKRAPFDDSVIQSIVKHSADVERHLTKESIGIIHTNDAGMHRIWGALKQKIEFIHVWHERGLFQHPAKAEEFLLAAEMVLTISMFVRDRAPVSIRDKVIVVDNPITIDRVYDRKQDSYWLKNEFDIPLDAKVFTMIANGNKRKRWDMFFEAAAKSIKSNKRHYFISVGLTVRSEINDLKHKYISSDVASNVIIAGYRYDALRFVSGTDALVSTAKNEPLGRTIVEAGMLGTPMIISSEGGHKELLQQLSPFCLVERADANKFKNEFDKIDELSSLYVGVRDDVADSMSWRFSPERHVKSVANLYVSVLGIAV
ncbi:glycosyltransferase [Aliiglaciecola sp. SL4]|uniref:glycosyltransferase n=1 Tax=Aliiglaciecola sp. SL4 TaxID=3239806 RepID=UPI00355C82D0